MNINYWILIAVASLLLSCKDEPILPPDDDDDVDRDTLVLGVDYFLPDVDLNNWKVTLPIGNPTEVEPPEILNYATNNVLKDFMYNDSTDGSLVFYTYPASSTPNSSYSRTELREQLVPGSNNTNWTFGQGGNMKGTLKMDEISKDNSGDYHRAIVMQIHGRLTDAQKDLIGQSDNNAPPVLKIYWRDQKIRVHRKILVDTSVNNVDVLVKTAWTDESIWFNEVVGFESFKLEVKVSEGRMEVILNDNESMVFDDIHVQRWGIFENYFKAGNYLITSDQNASSKVKYYELEINH